MVRGIGTKVFYVTTGGFDTHSGQNVNAINGAYYNLMGTLNDALFAFYTDLKGRLEKYGRDLVADARSCPEPAPSWRCACPPRRAARSGSAAPRSPRSAAAMAIS